MPGEEDVEALLNALLAGGDPALDEGDDEELSDMEKLPVEIDTPLQDEEAPTEESGEV
jgi:hypothetical protein